jgi:hypothetical protein
MKEAKEEKAALSNLKYELELKESDLVEREKALGELKQTVAQRALGGSVGVVSGGSGSSSPLNATRSRRAGTAGGMAAPLAAVRIDKSLNPEERKAKLRATVIEEIISTEDDYVSDLESLVELCIVPARKRLSAADLQQLFSNVEEIYHINKALLIKFQQRLTPSHPQHGVLGDLFQEMGESLRRYAPYCANQDTSVAAYLRLKEDPMVDAFLVAIETDLRGLDLCGFLIKPVQRLCKYPLLLRELLKFTDESHADCAALKKAETMVQQAVQYVNDYQKRLEAQHRLAELANAFVGLPAQLDIASSQRKFFCEVGVTELVDVGQGTSELRMLFVFSDLVLLAKPQTRSKLLAYKTHIPATHIRIKVCCIVLWLGSGGGDVINNGSIICFRVDRIYHRIQRYPMAFYWNILPIEQQFICSILETKKRKHMQLIC